jgi:hypothetical protein
LDAPDKERPGRRVEEGDVGDAALDEDRGFIARDVDDCRRRDSCDVSVEARESLREEGHVRPIRMKASATSAVPLSLARLRTRLSGRKTTIWARMSHLMSTLVFPLVTDEMKASRFSATKIV